MEKDSFPAKNTGKEEPSGSSMELPFHLYEMVWAKTKNNKIGTINKYSFGDVVILL